MIKLDPKGYAKVYKRRLLFIMYNYNIFFLKLPLFEHSSKCFILLLFIMMTADLTPKKLWSKLKILFYFAKNDTMFFPKKISRCPFSWRKSSIKQVPLPSNMIINTGTVYIYLKLQWQMWDISQEVSSRRVYFTRRFLTWYDMTSSLQVRILILSMKHISRVPHF